MDFSPLQGRWYHRREDSDADVEHYIDVNEELLFRAVHFRRGASRYKSQQVVLTIERLALSEGDWEIDLRVTRCIEDNRDVTEDFDGKLVKGRWKRDAHVLFLDLPEPGAPRPANLSSAARFERRSAK